VIFLIETASQVDDKTLRYSASIQFGSSLIGKTANEVGKKYKLKINYLAYCLDKGEIQAIEDYETKLDMEMLIGIEGKNDDVYDFLRAVHSVAFLWNRK